MNRVYETVTCSDSEVFPSSGTSYFFTIGGVYVKSLLIFHTKEIIQKDNIAFTTFLNVIKCFMTVYREGGKDN
jgi:hypothetical protein